MVRNDGTGGEIDTPPHQRIAMTIFGFEVVFAEIGHEDVI